MLQVFVHRNETELPVDIPSIESAFAERVKTHPFDDLARFVFAGNMRNDDPGGVSFQGANVVAVAATTDANERVDAMDAGSTDLSLEREPVIRDVLSAQPDGIDAAKTSDLNHPGIREIDLKHRGKVVLAKEFEHSART